MAMHIFILFARHKERVATLKLLRDGGGVAIGELRGSMQQPSAKRNRARGQKLVAIAA